MNRLGPEGHYTGDMYSQNPFAGSPPYPYNSPPPYKRSNPKESQFVDLNTDDSLARKLNLLTNSLNRGKPINVEDIMTLRASNEVSWITAYKLKKKKDINLHCNCNFTDWFKSSSAADGVAIWTSSSCQFKIWRTTWASSSGFESTLEWYMIFFFFFQERKI